MKRLGMLVVLLVWIMLFMIPCMSLASSGESTVAPAYLYTRNVKATLSVAKAADTDYARLYVTATSSIKNNVYRTYSGTDYTSRCYYKKTTTGTWMYYNTDIDSDTQVYLMGRPDSSVPSCTVTGKFGAG